MAGNEPPSRSGVTYRVTVTVSSMLTIIPLESFEHTFALIEHRFYARRMRWDHMRLDEPDTESADSTAGGGGGGRVRDRRPAPVRPGRGDPHVRHPGLPRHDLLRDPGQVHRQPGPRHLPHGFHLDNQPLYRLPASVVLLPEW